MKYTQKELAQLYEDHHPRVWKAALTRLKNYHNAEDVVQDSFRKLAEEDSDKLRGRELNWLLLVTKNASYHIHIKANRITEIFDHKDTRDNDQFMDCNQHKTTKDIEFAADQSPLEHLVSKETKNTELLWLYSALENLPEDSQEVMRLRYFEELDYNQIAEKLNITAFRGSYIVYKTLHKLRKEYLKHGH
jgi:RNA polymerase sigma factor (sigma-70 family)